MEKVIFLFEISVVPALDARIGIESFSASIVAETRQEAINKITSAYDGLLLNATYIINRINEISPEVIAFNG